MPGTPTPRLSLPTINASADNVSTYPSVNLSQMTTLDSAAIVNLGALSGRAAAGTYPAGTLYKATDTGDLSITASGAWDPIERQANKNIASGYVGLNASSGASIAGTLVVGSNAPQSNALLSAIVAGNGIEFGHPNTAGYRSTLGAEANSGIPFLVFSGAAGTTANTYTTNGLKASVFKGDLAGGFLWGTVAAASAANQALVSNMTLSAGGALNLTGALTVGTTVAVTGTALSFAGTTQSTLYGPSGAPLFVQGRTSGGTGLGAVSFDGTGNATLQASTSTGTAALGFVQATNTGQIDIQSSNAAGTGYTAGIFLSPAGAITLSPATGQVVTAGAALLGTWSTTAGYAFFGAANGAGAAVAANSTDTVLNAATTGHFRIGNGTDIVTFTAANVQVNQKIVSGVAANGSVMTIGTSGNYVYESPLSTGRYYFGYIDPTTNTYNQCGFQSGAFLNSSDARLKENIQPLGNALATVLKLQGVTHTWIGDEEENVTHGFIGQDVRKVVPEVVAVGKLAAGGPDDMHGIEYGKLVPLLVEAIKELTAKVNTLTTTGS